MASAQPTPPLARDAHLLDAPLLRFAHAHRIAVSRAATLALAGVLTCTWHSWPADGWLQRGLAAAGFVLVTLGASGRLYAQMFLGGRKSKELVAAGPYARVRNPLYAWSFVGTIGLALTSGNVLFAGILLLLYAGFYPFVILAEERRLRTVHGDAFVAYQRAVPRFLPRPKVDAAPLEYYEVNMRGIRRALLENLCWPLGWLLLVGADLAHAAGWLPNLLLVP